MKRLEILMNKENNLDEFARFQVKQDEYQLGLDLLATQKELSRQTKLLTLAKAEKVLNPSDIINIINEMEGLKNAIKVFKELQKELF